MFAFWGPILRVVGLGGRSMLFWAELGARVVVVVTGLCLVYQLATRFWRNRRPPYLEADMRFCVGRPGSGKTLISVKHAILAMRKGLAVYANTPIIDPVSGRRSGLVEGWAHLLYMTTDPSEGGLGLRNFFVLVDEGNVWACSRLSKQIPIWLLFWWSHRRKFGAEIHITSQHENRVDVVLRETVDKIDVCERSRFLPRYLPLFWTTECFPEELEALRGGAVKSARARFMPWWVYAGYTTTKNIPPIDLDAERAPKMAGERIVHPNYLPGMPWDGVRVSKRERLQFSGPRSWSEWECYLEVHPEISAAAIETSVFEAWVRSEVGMDAIFALAG